MNIRLTPAQISALECAGLDCLEDGDRELAILRDAWRGAALTVTPSTRDDVFTALIDRANAEDAGTDVFARRACRSLGSLASKVLRAA